MPERTSPVTLKVLAADLNLSVTTVCNALRDLRIVSPKTRTRVQSRARELGYVPNLHAAQLGQRKTSDPALQSTLLGLYFNPLGPGERVHGNELPGLTPAKCREYGFSLEVHAIKDQQALQKRLQKSLHAGIQAVVIHGPAAYYIPTYAESRLWKHFSVLQLNGSMIRGSTPFNTVEMNFFNQTYYCIKRAMDLGYRRIGVSMPTHSGNLLDDEIRTAACMVCQKDLDPSSRIPIFRYPATELGTPAPRGFREWLERWKPDVLIGFTDASYYWPRDCGYEKHRELGFACLICHPDSSGIAGNIVDYNLPEVVLSTLRNMVYLKHQGLAERPRRIMVEPKWRDGESLPRKRQAATASADPQ